MLFKTFTVAFGFILFSSVVFFYIQSWFLSKQYSILQERTTQMKLNKFKKNLGLKSFLAEAIIVPFFYFLGITLFKLNEANMLVSLLMAIITFFVLCYQELRYEDAIYNLEKAQKERVKKIDYYSKLSNKDVVLIEKRNILLMKISFIVFCILFVLYVLDVVNVINIQHLLIGEIAPNWVLFSLDGVKWLALIICIQLMGRGFRNILENYTKHIKEGK